jgi:hypothetical protein
MSVASPAFIVAHSVQAMRSRAGSSRMIGRWKELQPMNLRQMKPVALMSMKAELVIRS